MMLAFRKDIERYKDYSSAPSLFLILTQQGLWALFVYRINNFVYRSKLPYYIRRLFLMFGLIFQKMMEIFTGISLPYSARIGEGLYIGHFGGIVINSDAVIGKNCNISQGVTIGVSGRGDRRGVPIIGDKVYIGANSVVAGAIAIGDNVLIAANSLVTSSVSSNKTVIGVPAKEVGDSGSEGYI